jgi:hypothetical protein
MTRSSRWFPFLLAVTLTAPAAAIAGGVALEDDAGTPPPPAPSAACTLTPGDANTFSFIWTPPEELRTYAWKLPTGSCAACPSGTLELDALTFRMRWPFACSATAEVLIVGAVQGATCLEPDTTNVLCGPTSHTIARVGTVLNVVHTLPIATDCCISGDAFLLVKFSGLGACATPTIGPGLAAATGPCVPCSQFVTAFNIFENRTEWCSVGAANPTWFSIDAECCAGTPNLKGSWGSVKTLYR